MRNCCRIPASESAITRWLPGALVFLLAGMMWVEAASPIKPERVKEIAGWLPASAREIGPAAILSRAIGGLMGHVIVLVMPGSQAAVRLAMEKIIVPELPHFVREARKK